MNYSKPFGFSPGTLFFLFLLAFQFLFSLLLSFIRIGVADTALALPLDVFLRSPGGLIFLQIMRLLVPLGIWLALRRETLDMHMPTMKLGGTNAILIIALSFFLLPYMSLLSGLMALLFPNPVTDFFTETQRYSTLVLLFAAAVTPAVVEEVVFRGYIQSQYKERHWFYGVFLSGFLFGIIHISPQQIPYAFAMGIVMAYLVYITRSVRAGILSHFIVNAFNVLLFRGLTWLMNAQEAQIRASGDREALAEWEAALTASADASHWDTFLVLGVVALVFLPFIIFIFRALMSHNRQRMTTYDIKQALVMEDDKL